MFYGYEILARDKSVPQFFISSDAVNRTDRLPSRGKPFLARTVVRLPRRFSSLEEITNRKSVFYSVKSDLREFEERETCENEDSIPASDPIYLRSCAKQPRPDVVRQGSRSEEKHFSDQTFEKRLKGGVLLKIRTLPG